MFNKPTELQSNRSTAGATKVTQAEIQSKQGISHQPTEVERQEITRKIVAYSRSLESRNPLTLDELNALRETYQLDQPATSTPAPTEPKPQVESPGLQWLKAQFQEKSKEDVLLEDLQKLHDRSSLWPIFRVRDVVQQMGISIFVASEIPSDLRARLGMSADTAAAADTERRWIIVDQSALSKGCSELNVHPIAGLAAAILHECSHILLGHQGSHKLSQRDRLAREDMAWCMAEKLHSDHSLHGYIPDWQLRKMARFSINSHSQAA